MSSTASSNRSGPAPTVEVGPLRLWSPVILAPMAGVTDAPFRRLCRLYGEEGLPAELTPDSAHHAQRGVDAPAGLYVTEMVTSRALVEGRERTRDMVRPDPTERVRSIQLYGVDPAIMGAAARVLVEEDLADHIDINFGCPVPKVTRKGGGAALPWKRDLFSDIVASVVSCAEDSGRKMGRDVPVTVKMRVGIDDDHVTFVDAAQIAQSKGAAAVALHARTQTQHYSGQADWTQIARLKDLLTIPVFGNGDIFEGVDAVRMMEQTGCDAVVIGRGCQGRPWLFRDIVAAVHGQDIPAQPNLREIADIILRHAQWVVEDQVTFVDAAQIAQSKGAAAVALHARTQTQHYSGQADWTQIARLKDLLTIPVFGNGDIFEGEDAVRMMEQTGCDAVVIGRGCQGRPWLFRDIVAAVHGREIPTQPNRREIADLILRQAQWVVEDQGDELRALREMRKHVGWYMRGFSVGGPARAALNLVSSLDELRERLAELDLDQPFPQAAQGPRGRAGGEKTPHLPDGWLDSPYLTEGDRAQLPMAEDGVSGG